MCTTNIYTYVYPDGRKETTRVPSLCSHARHGIPCAKNVFFQHPTSYVSNAGESSSAPSAGSPFLPVSGGHFPPTPSYTPRSSTPIRSGDESDRSGYRSGSSSRGKRSSPAVYVNGHKYELDPASAAHGSPSSSRHHSRKSSRTERVVVREGPPSPRTPPTAFTAPHTAPSSPSGPYIVDVNRRSSSATRNPVIVDIVDPYEYRSSHKSSHRDSKRHSRHTSTSSHDSGRRSHDEEEAAAARHRRRERKQQEYEAAERRQAQKSVHFSDRIAAANAHIASRKAVPVAPAPLRRSNTTTYHRDTELAEAVRGLNLDSSSERRRQRAQEAEEKALNQRLKDRMTMPRRATVSGSRKTQVLYDDGTYRWE